MAIDVRLNFHVEETCVNKKIFRGAILETILLNLISEASERGLHGYAIFGAIRKKFGVNLGPSTLYPELALMERHGLVESSWDIAGGKARRIFKITRKGQTVLREYSLELKIVIPACVPYGQ
jgi:DNA-binding PadR family transcriptional regulator